MTTIQTTIVALFLLVSCMGCIQLELANLGLISDRIVPEQYTRIYNETVEGMSCHEDFTYPHDGIAEAARNALELRPGADALVKVDVRWVRDDESAFGLGGCFVVSGTPVTLK